MNNPSPKLHLLCAQALQTVTPARPLCQTSTCAGHKHGNACGYFTCSTRRHIARNFSRIKTP
jgi:hypothetical protein